MIFPSIPFAVDLAEACHREGISNRHVLDNVQRIENIPMIIRPLVPGATATEENLRTIGQFLSGKSNLLYYQLLNFDSPGASNMRALVVAIPMRMHVPLGKRV